MKDKTFINTAAVIFGIVALLHLWRAVGGLPLIVGTYELPVFLSYAAVLVTGYLSYWGFKLAK